MADFISREAALEALRKYKVDPFDVGFLEDTIFGFSDGIDTAISKLSVMPAADVRPVVRGKWIKKGCYAFCSNCGERKAITWPTTVEELVNVYRLKFCPNCGADMREVKSDEK